VVVARHRRLDGGGRLFHWRAVGAPRARLVTARIAIAGERLLPPAPTSVN
jgi:hypothetical protein